jgi:putative nucleotidyltransferase with HDIG domain
MKKFNLPTRQQCFEIIKEYRVPSHILKHSVAAAKLAVFLAERLKEKGEAVDVDLVDRGCLLHDIARVCDFKELDHSQFEQTTTEQDKVKWQQIRGRYKGTCHEDAAYDILKEKYPVLALTIKKEKLVYYADMRAMHGKIVPLETRLKEAHKRNVHLHGSKAQSRINTAKVDPLIYRLEEEIFDKIGLSPLEVTNEFIDSYQNRMQRAD